MTLGSLAFGLDTSQALTLSTDFTKGGSTGGNNYTGIAFQLTPGTDRYTNSNLLTEDATYELTGIVLQWRNNTNPTTKVEDGVQLVVTNASDQKVLGISNSISSLVDGPLPGKEGDQIHLAVTTFETPITLALETPYYAFYVTDANVQDLKVGDTLTVASVSPVNLMAQGGAGAYTNPNTDFGTAQGLAPFGPNYAPIGYLTVTKNSNVPEPTTGTLSLLALAGLCIRRRK